MFQSFRELTENFRSLFISGTKILRPIIDVVSKRLLEQNKEALISLLTAVLSPQSAIEEVTILNPELRNGPSHDDKLSRLDMLVRLHAEFPRMRST